MNLSVEDIAIILKCIDIYLTMYDADREERDDVVLLQIELKHYLKEAQRRNPQAPTSTSTPPPTPNSSTASTAPLSSAGGQESSATSPSSTPSPERSSSAPPTTPGRPNG